MLKESDKEFLKPRWKRIATLSVLIAWAAAEWYWQEPFWGVVVTALAGWAYWQFFVVFDRES